MTSGLSFHIAGNCKASIEQTSAVQAVYPLVVKHSRQDQLLPAEPLPLDSAVKLISPGEKDDQWDFFITKIYYLLILSS
jgi:hypothetical protein